jgi:hypothetical protein
MNFDKNRENCDIFVILKTRKFYASEKTRTFLFLCINTAFFSKFSTFFR